MANTMYKIHVGNNPELSKRIQEIAFSFGIEWGSWGAEVKYTDQPYLYFTDKLITYSEEDDPKHFIEHPGKQIP